MQGTLRIVLDEERLIQEGVLTRNPKGELSWATRTQEEKVTNPASFTLSGGQAYMEHQVDLAHHGLVGVDEDGYAIRYSWFGFMPADPHRRFGTYEHRAATGYVDASERHTHLIRLEIFGPTYESVRAMYEEIRLGNLWPTKDYSAKQIQEDSTRHRD